MELLSYLINMLAIIFTLVRGYASFMLATQKQTPFFIANQNVEIAMLFVALICIIMIMRRNIIFASIYLACIFAYYGYTISLLLKVNTPQNNFEIFTLAVGILIAALNFIDVLLNKNRKGSTKNTKTDWFYATDKYEREIDQRADRNQYRI